jgi:broad specificity phosphatase PhoE
MSTLYLIRHGQASFGADDYDRLSGLGRRQARAAGDFLVRAGIRFDACWSGRLRRQRQTAVDVGRCFQQAGADLPAVVASASLDEYDYETVLRTLAPVIIAEDPDFRQAVDVMLADRGAFQAVFGRVMRRWASGKDTIDALPPWSAFDERVTAAIATIMRENTGGRRVAVFTSGGPIAVMVGHVLDLNPEKTIALSWQLVNASLTRIRFGGGRISLATFNEYGFLETGEGDGRVTYR